jgi:tetratricopeptide (TPR) repeat protein
MTERLAVARIVFLLAGSLALAAPAAGAQNQDPLARAKTYYASADYEEALAVLKDLTGRTEPPADGTEVAAYRLFCLMALGRSNEARQEVERIVRTDPLYHPSESQASPRVRTFFEEVRRPLLPDVIKQSYAVAKAAFDRKDMAEATTGFDRVIALVDESGDAQPGFTDLRTLASGFRDLSKAAQAPPPVPEPVEPPSAPIAAIDPATLPVPAPAEPAIYGVEDADVTKPVAISRELPTWRPNTVEERQLFAGALELVIDENGRVSSVALRKSVHPVYDPMLVRAAKDWTFRPATRNGVPVRYRFLLGVQLGR